MDISNRLKKAYKNSHFSNYNELAISIGVSKSTIDKWMSGKVNPENKNLDQIAQVLNVSVEWLMFGIEEIPTQIKEDFVENLFSYSKNSNAPNSKDEEIYFLYKQLKEKTDHIDLLKDKIASLEAELKKYKP